MDLELRGKTALITGASKGIGKAVADALAGEGVSVHLVARTASDLNKAADEIRASRQVSVTTHALDLSDSASIAQLQKDAPLPDIVVNNAGAIPGGSIDMVDEAKWREAWDLKVFGYINMCRAYYGAMCERGSGVIVNVTGIAADMLNPGYIAGACGNSSVNALSRSLGARSLDHGVRVLAVSPGLVRTERLVRQRRVAAEIKFGDPDRWEDLLTTLPGGRPAEPREIADVVAFAASPRASYLTGVVINVDGGRSADSSD